MGWLHPPLQQGEVGALAGRAGLGDHHVLPARRRGLWGGLQLEEILRLLGGWVVPAAVKTECSAAAGEPDLWRLSASSAVPPGTSSSERKTW